MASGSILVDWHVARALGSSAEEIEAYTAIRHCFRCKASSGAQLIAAIEELALMRAWARAAALPDLCRLARRQSPSVVTAIHDTMFAAVRDDCSPAVQQPLTAALTEFSSGSIVEALRTLRTLAAILVSRGTVGEPETSLFSLERHEEVSAALAMLVILAEEDPALTSEFMGRDFEDASAAGLQTLLDLGLGGVFGRTQMLQSVDICLSLRELTRAQNALGLPKREPDFMHRCARMAYLLSTEAGTGDLAGWACAELSLFAAFGALFGGWFDSASRSDRLEGIAFWQDAVLATAMTGNIAIFAKVLGPMLKPRWEDVHAAQFSLPREPSSPDQLMGLYRDLLWELGEGVNKVSFGNRGYPSGYAVTPWFWALRNPTSKGQPLPQTASFYLRLAGWAVVVCELLAVADDLDSQSDWARYLGTFLLHAHHWLNALQRDRRQSASTIEATVRELVNAAFQLVSATGVGKYHHPSPAFLTDLATAAAKDSPTKGNEIGRWRDTVDRQYESVLVLLQQALAVTEDELRAGRWLADSHRLTEPAIEWFGERIGKLKHLKRPNYIALCFRRFVEAGPVMAEGPEAADPLQAVRRDGAWEAIYKEHRALLLRDVRRYIDWACGEDEVPSGSSSFAAPLAVALQRVAAAGEDPTTPAKIRLAWQGDLRRVLSLATDLQDFDRFVQLRCVEVLRARLIHDDAELVALIVSRLLEFGSNQTFAALGRWFRDEPVTSDLDANLRVEFFGKISRYIGALAAARIRTEAPRSPDSRSRHAARAHVLGRLAAASLIAPNSWASTGAILMGARAARDANVVRLFSEESTTLPVEVNQHGQVMSVTIPNTEFVTATLLAFDATELAIKRNGPISKDRHGLSLFAGATPDARNKATYVGVALSSDAAQTAIALQPSAEPIHHRPGSPTIRQGDLVSVECGPVRNGGFDEIGTPRAIGQNRRIEHWAVSTQKRSGPGYEFLAAPVSGPSVPMTQSTINLLAIFSPHPSLPNYGIRVATASGGEHVHPVVGTFADLLIDEAEEISSGACITLCLRSIVRNQSGAMIALEVETWPLRLYRLEARHDLSVGALDALEAELARLGPDSKSRGLFFATRAEVTADGPRLQPSVAGPVQPRWSGQVLATPFDDRNLKWRKLFSAADVDDDTEDGFATVIECTRVPASSLYATNLAPGLRVEGFPETVGVRLLAVGHGAESVLAMVDRQNDGRPHVAELFADELPTTAVEGLTQSELVDLVEWLLKGGQKRVLAIRSYAKRVWPNGFTPAFSSENLPVQLLAESLSLKPLNLSPSSAIWRRRDAVVRAQFRSSSRDPEFDVGSVPQTAFENDVARGILTSFPRQLEAGSCMVAWRTGDTVTEVPLQVENLPEVVGRKGRPELGSRIVVDRRTQPPGLRFEMPNFTGEALWQIADGDTLEPASYVGTADVGAFGTCDLYETDPGVIAVTPASTTGGPPHVRYASAHFAGRAIVGISQRPILAVPFRNQTSWHVAFAFENRAGEVGEPALAGLSASSRPELGRSLLTAYELFVEGTDKPDSLRILRRLRTRAQGGELTARPAVVTQAPAQGLSSDEKRRRELAELLSGWAAAQYVEGRHDDALGAFIPAHPFAQRLVPRGVPIAPGAMSRRSPFDPVSEYSGQPARLRLKQTAPLVGSYLDVPASDLDGLLVALGHPDPGQTVLVNDLSLSYVGIERGPKGGIQHLFEWGYGSWACIDQSLLRYKGGAFQQADLSLAFGDRIKSVRVVTVGDSVVLSIEDADLSDPHLLYRQAKRDRIVHVLQVSSSTNGGVRIDSVNAFEERDAASISRPFSRVAAELAPESALAIGNLLRGQFDGAGRSVTVYGRLMTESFLKSGGTDLVYQAVTSELEGRDGFGVMQEDDRMFVRVTAVRRSSNDLALAVSPVSTLERSLTGTSSKPVGRRDEWRLARRWFSHDEGALARITSGKTEISGRELLVRLRSVQRGRFDLVHRDAAPPRSSRLLDGMLVRGGGRLLAVFAGSAKAHVSLEVRPGVVVRVEEDRVDCPKDVAPGDILRIERIDAKDRSRYRCTSAIHGDLRYARTRRPVVVLPKNMLGRLLPPYADPDTLRTAMSSFGVGDLRQISAELKPGLTNEETTDADALARFMTGRHPKLAWLESGSDRRAMPRLYPDHDDEILAGRLEVETPRSKPPTVRVIALAGDQRLSGPVDWHDLTFFDGAATQVKATLADRTWRYHDRSTIAWREDDGGVQPALIDLPPQSARSGPLFFENDGQRPTLRYRGAQLSRHLIGFANLRGELPRAPQRALAAVVARAADDGGLLIELLPGRIYEVPAALCSSDDAEHIALDGLAWEVFAPGDTIWLRGDAARTDRYEQEGILLSWKHGSRNAFGPMGALVPKIGEDRSGGCVIFGAGELTVAIPTSDPDNFPDLAIVGGEEGFQPASDGIRNGDPAIELAPGTTVLLTRGKQGELMLAGLNDCVVEVASEAPDGTPIDWKADPFLRQVVRLDASGRPVVDAAALMTRLDLIGGALPVTVERANGGANGEPWKVLFSRRHQMIPLGDGKHLLADVVGYLPQFDVIVLRVGGLHFEVAAQGVVAGAPRSLWPAILAALVDSRTGLWVRGVDNFLHVGLTPRPAGSIKVRTIAVVSSSPQAPETAGVLCVGTGDSQLYWLAAEHAGATRLAAAQLEAAFPSEDAPFEVSRIDGGGISLVQDPRVQAELKRLRPGVATMVRRVGFPGASPSLALPEFAGPTEGASHLVRSTATGLLFSVVAAHDWGTLDHSGTTSVEIAWRWLESGSIRLVGVERGRRTMRSDFPDGLVQGSGWAAEAAPCDARLSGENLSLDGNVDGAAPAMAKSLISESAYGLLTALGLLQALWPERSNQVSLDAFLLLTADIQSRALRSFHLEQLAAWHANFRVGDVSSLGTFGLQKRVNELLGMVGSKGQSPSAAVIAERLESLVLFSSLHPQPFAASLLVHALSAGLGGGHDLSILFEGSNIMAQLTTVLRPFALGRNQLTLTDLEAALAPAMTLVTQIAEHLANEGFDIPMPRGFATGGRHEN